MRASLFNKYLMLSLTLIAVSPLVTAEPSLEPPGRAFVEGTPVGPRDLPPGRVRDKIDSLPPAAQEQAIAWLQRFSFAEEDLEFIEVDGDGGVLYADTVLPELTEAPLEDNASLPAETAADVFALHSKPGSTNVLFLDFDGHTITGTAWNGSEPSFSAAPFNTESGDGTLTDNERAQIQEIWHRIAEDFAPFDVDVTTEQPTTFTNTTGHVLITRNTDTTGKAMPYSNAGGVAYVGVWGSSNYAYYSPALVYYDNLASATFYIAEAAAHEAGHNLNLSHDGSASNSYYSGHGSGFVSWAPIMGVGYYNNVTQWSKGEYSGATNTQDDLSILSNYLTQRNDDHGDTAATATALLVSGAGLVGVTNPETDPGNLQPENKGIIEDRNDTDIFTFVAGGGNVDITATPAWDAYYRTNKRGANLDIELTLADDTGVVAISDPADDTFAQITAEVVAGRYYLEITGVGNALSPYSDYGSLGQYFLSGSVPTLSTDTTAPNPDPMTWAVAPLAIDRSSVTMTASTATDDSGAVEYQFICVAGGQGCLSSSWQSSPEYTAVGLQASTLYSFQVRARDLSNNMTGTSDAASTTTAANLAPVANNDIAGTNEDSSVVIAVLANDSDPEGDTLTVASVGDAANGATTANGSSVTYTPNANYSGADSFTYTISDGFGGSATATVDVSIMPVNDGPTAVNDTATVATNSTVTINVLANDSDPEGDTLTLVSVNGGSKGSASVVGQSVSYSSGKKRGNDTLTYTVSDGEISTAATITISIQNTGKDDGGAGGSGKCHPKKGC